MNTADEVCKALEGGGVSFPCKKEIWFGESPQPAKTDVFARAGAVQDHLSLTVGKAQALISRWWRYYDVQAHDLIDRLHPQSHFVHPAQMITDTEIDFIRDTEMALCDADIRRRRTNLYMAEGPCKNA